MQALPKGEAAGSNSMRLRALQLHPYLKKHNGKGAPLVTPRSLGLRFQKEQKLSQQIGKPQAFIESSKVSMIRKRERAVSAAQHARRCSAAARAGGTDNSKLSATNQHNLCGESSEGESSRSFDYGVVSRHLPGTCVSCSNCCCTAHFVIHRRAACAIQLHAEHIRAGYTSCKELLR